MFSPGLPLQDLSSLVEQFEANRANWRSYDQYRLGLTTIISDSNIPPAQAYAVLKATPPFASRFQDAHGSQQVRDLFRALFEASGCPFTPEDQKISQSKFKNFISHLIASRNKFDLDNIDILKLAISSAFTKIGLPDPENFLDNACEELVTNFQDGFSKGDITHAAKTLFETLGYQIKETSDEDTRILGNKEILSNSMAAPFQGKSARALFNYIQKCQHEFIACQPYSKRYYAKFFSVCNSSGTGKTKTVLELRNLGVCVVYINLRPATDTDNFPPRDDAIALLFESAVRTCTEPESFEKCAITIFRALFQNLRREFEQITRRRGSSASEVVHAWNDLYAELNTDDSNRSSFFSSVSERYYHLFKPEAALEDLQKLLERDHSALLALPCFKNSRQFLVIALDEVQGLAVPNANYLPSHILGRVIQVFSTSKYNLSLWVIFTSTNTRIAHFAAPTRMHSSQRVVVPGEQFFPPFNLLQLDIFARRMEELDLFDVGSYNDVIQSGRPLWESVKGIYENTGTMSDFAAIKLIGLGEKENDHLLAALSQRFSLQVAMGSRDAVTYLEDSIASHMRYVLHTHDDRSWQFTCYPSEPVLSDAAADILYGTEDALSTAISALATKVGDRVIDAGEYGELISRLLVLISRDVTTIRAYDMSPARTLHNPHPEKLSFEKFPLRENKDYFDYLRPVAVLDVLDTLFGPGWTRGQDNKDQREEIKRDFANAFISASHWISMTNNVGDRPAGMDAVKCLSTLYKTGVALQCVHGQDLVDKVIPIMFLNDVKNCCVGWSAIYIQDKNRQMENANALHNIDPSHYTIDLATNMPYIAICFDFGVPATKTTTSTRSTRTLPRTFARTERNNNWIRIHATGLDSEIFPVLKARPDFATSLIRLWDTDCRNKEADNNIEQYILTIARFATSGFHFLRGPDIPFEGQDDAVPNVEMAEEPAHLADTSGASGHGGRKRKRVPSSTISNIDHGLGPEDVAMEDSVEASGS
ncbi:hypothetical protein VKT23_019623 [Stygiomarasmius scandens]|uniref:Uncharacterized protein n=1 Tax=Marasmiellus scandens TaxID=2682957 RepID=A0ABR1IKV6_9AGAR